MTKYYKTYVSGWSRDKLSEHFTFYTGRSLSDRLTLEQARHICAWIHVPKVDWQSHVPEFHRNIMSESNSLTGLPKPGGSLVGHRGFGFRKGFRR